MYPYRPIRGSALSTGSAHYELVPQATELDRIEGMSGLRRCTQLPLPLPYYVFHGNISQSETQQLRPKEESEELNLKSDLHYKAGSAYGCQWAHSAPCGRRKRFRAEPGVERRFEPPQRTEGKDQQEQGACPADGGVEQWEGTHESTDIEEEQRDV